MAEIVDTKGNKIDGPKPQDIAAKLRELLAEIEAGEISAEAFYLIVPCERRLKGDGALTEYQILGYDSGLTLEQAVMLLEREKFRLLCAGDGVAYR